MPIDGTIVAAGAAAPAPQPAVTNFTPSTPTAPHAAEVAKAAGEAPVKEAPATKPGETPAPGKEGEAPEAKVEAWRLASLAKKEKAARERAEEARRAEQGLKARQAELEARETRVREAEEARQKKMQAYRANPLELLREYGLDYNQVSEFVARGQWTPEQATAFAIKQAQETAAAAAAETAQLRQEQAEREAKLRKELEERDQTTRSAQADGAVQAFKSEIAEFIQADPEAYELMGRDLPAAVEAMYEYVDEQFEKTGKMVSKKAAAEYIEGRIFDELNKVITTTKKFGKLQPAARPPQTLRNNLGATRAAPQEERGQETEAERRARVTKEIEQVWAARRK